MRKNRIPVCGIVGLATMLFAITAPCEAQGDTSYRIVYAFTGGSDGALPNSALTRDSAGDLYGTTEYGGDTRCNGGYGCGTVYELTVAGKLKVLYTFASGDGIGFGGLILDGSGDLYGASGNGGSSGCGTIYEIAQNGAHSVIYTFLGGNDGCGPNGLIRDQAGNFYGTTALGGGAGCGSTDGCGTAFRIAPDGVETQLYVFKGTAQNDGYYPNGTLLRDKHGNLYGTTIYGASATLCHNRYNSGCGTVFEISPKGLETIRYAFQGGSDGAYPSAAPLVADSDGNLYGSTQGGGGHNKGTIFRLAPDGTETLLYAFAKARNGDIPTGVIRDKSDGHLFGTTTFGGPSDDGVVFALQPDGKQTVLHSFGSGNDGDMPIAPPTMNAGMLYGTTLYGGGTNVCATYTTCGTIFAIAK